MVVVFLVWIGQPGSWNQMMKRARSDVNGVWSDANRDRFVAFYRRELDGQVRRASLLLHSDEAGNDVVHDAFVKIYERWGDIEDPGPYLNRAVLNGCRDIGRRQTISAAADVRLHASVTVAPDDVLFDVLDALPFNQRASVILRFYGRMTENEIAEALDCRPGSVGPWISRALATMRKELS